MPKLSARTAATGIILVALVLASGIAWWASSDDQPADSREVVVGLRESAPLLYTNDEGQPAGMFPELLVEIAHRERWRLRWVSCDFADCLGLLDQGELDLVPALGFSSERDRTFDYHRDAVATTLLRVYVSRESDVSTVDDLSGSTIALLRGSLLQTGFRDLANEADIDFAQLEIDSLDAGYQAVLDGEADAVVATSFFGAYNAQKYHLTETPIIFLPTAIYFATSQGENPDLLAAIDSQMALWRTDPDSVYFDILNRTIAGQPREAELPRWGKWALITLVGMVLLISLIALVLRHKGRRRTQTLLNSAEELATQRANLENLVSQRTIDLTAAKEEAERLSNVKSDFLANVSHEIRTPMNAILGMVYLALDSDPSPVVRNQLLKTQSSAQSLLGIINDILDVTKIESGRIELENIEFDVEALLVQLADSVGFHADQKEIEFLIRYEPPEVPPLLVGDPLRVGQVLRNICNNAIKFTDRGEVEVFVQHLGQADDEVTLKFSVMDSGIGISAEQQEKLFQSFTQADQSTTRRFGGSGLGLAISKGLVEIMGGRIWIEDSQPGRGTTVCFTVRLGLAKAATEHRRDLTARLESMLEGIRVLVVDDHDNSRGILVELLSHLGLDVVPAANGREALDLVGTAHSPFDIILLDWRMPGMNGDEVAILIRTDNSIERQPKIVMISSHGRESPLYLDERAAVDAFLVKPISPSILLDTLVSVLGRERLLTVLSQTSSEPFDVTQNGLLAGTTVLLVEDNEINREFAAELLRREGITVHEAVNGREAVECVRQTDFDAVLMDIHMPEMDGIEAAERIRALADVTGGERYASLPIIAMTALAMAHDAERSREAGMNDHLTKPIDPAHLFATLVEWIPVPPGRPALSHGTAPSGRPQIPPELLALKTIKPLEGVRRIGGSADSYIRQLKRFRKHYGNAIEELQRTIADQGLRRAEEFCHALRGVVGNLAADRLFDAVSSIDAHLRAGLAPPSPMLGRAAAELDSLVAEIDGLQSPGSKRPSGRREPREAEIKSLVDRLKAALRYDFGNAAPLIRELDDATAGTRLEDQFNEFHDLVDIFEIDAAVELLNKMILPIEEGQR